MTDVLVVGAGVAGLVVAGDLAQNGLDVVVCEAGHGAGGLLGRGRLGGIDIDLGAESFATRTDAVAALIAEEELTDRTGRPLQIVAPRPGGAHLAVQTATGTLRAPLPRRTVLGIPADPAAADVALIIGEDGAARALAERELPPYRCEGPEPSLADLVAERCGPAVAERLVEPLCRSVYSQSARSALLSRLHPGVWQRLAERGTLIDAAADLAAPTRAGAAVAGIAGGMWQLADALGRRAEGYGVEIRTAIRVEQIAQVAGGWCAETSAGPLPARQVVVATGPAAASDLVPGAAAEPGPAVTVVAALVTCAALDAHPVGSGVIVDPALPAAAKALTHVTAKWGWAADRLPAGTHIVRLSARDADGEGLADPAGVAAAIALLTGVPITPADVREIAVQRWTDAVVPAAAAPEPSGIRRAGAAVAGTGLASVIPHARALARELSDSLTATRTRSTS